MDHNIKTELADDGVLIARIDMPGRSMNVFSLDMMDSLERLLRHVEGNTAIRAVVLTSGKQAFLAGADLDMIRMFTERARSDSAAQLHEICGLLGRLFRRLETSAKPYVAAINGIALGGGLEVSLACHARVVSDDKKIALGLPEIKLGLLPGAGGTQRLPRLIGTSQGLKMLLTGISLNPEQALEAGLVDQVVAPADLVDSARQLALSLCGRCAKADISGPDFNTAPFDFSAADALVSIAHFYEISDYQLKNYPAFSAILNCVLGGWNKSMDAACHWEMDCFVELIQNPVAGNMVRTLFLNRQRAGKTAPVTLCADTVRIAVLGENAEGLRARLARGGAKVIDEHEISDDDISVLMHGAERKKGIAVAWLETAFDEPAEFGAKVGVWVSESTEHGCAIEINGKASAGTAIDAGILIGKWLRANVLVTSSKAPLLPRLRAASSTAKRLQRSENEILLAVSLAAAEIWSEGGVDDLELADVAIVIAGLFPSYTGGPFNYLRQMGLEDLRKNARIAAANVANLYEVPTRIDQLFAMSS